MKNLICYHILTIDRYEYIISEAINECKNCFDYCDKVVVFVNDVGKNIDRVKQLFSDIDCEFIVHTNNNFEFDTLNYLRDFSLNNPNWNIGYIHTKGVSTGSNSCIDDWRRYMLYFVGRQYKRCISLLQNYDAVGVDLVDEPVKHYSGNFWWATSNYIKTLPKPEDIPVVLTKRHNAEFWICSGEGRFNSLHNSNIDVYKRHMFNYPDNLYRGNFEK